MANRLTIGFAIAFAVLTALAVIGVAQLLQQRQDFENATARSYETEIHARNRFARGQNPAAAEATIHAEQDRRRSLRDDIDSQTRNTALLAEKLDDPITVRFGPQTQKEAAPSMTRRLLAGIIALEKKSGITPDELEAARESAAAIEAALEADARLVAELEASQRKPGGRAADRAGGQAGASKGSKRRKPK